MPVTKYFAKVWSSPKQKEQIFFRVDPTTQRPLRVGCICYIKPVIIPPPPPPIINFDNCTATSYPSSNISTITVSWFPVVGATSYKVFYSFQSSTDGLQDDTLSGNPLSVLRSNSRFFDGGDSGPINTLTFTQEITDNTHGKVSAYVFAYNGTTRSAFPVSKVTAINQTMYLDRTTKDTYTLSDSTLIYDATSARYVDDNTLMFDTGSNEATISSKAFT